jgi:hypothetical protein
LTSNITTSSVLNQSGNVNNTTDVLDLNGNMLAVTDASHLFGLPTGGTGGIWTLVTTNATQGGTISATGFDLSGSPGGSSVGSNVNLIATKGGLANVLSNTAGGTINAASTFTYAPTTLAATASTLSSSRTIGSVALQAGTLALGTSLTTASTSGVTVAAGSTLNLNALTLSTGNLTATGTITGVTTSKLTASGAFTGTGTIGAASGITSSGTLSAGTVGTVGTIVLSGGVFTLAGTDRVDINSTSSFDQVSILGGSVVLSNGMTIDAEFTANPSIGNTYQIFSAGVTAMSFNLTSNLDSNYTFAFNPGDGTLTVLTPEPTSLAMVGGAGLFMLRRRRRSRRVMSS